MKLPQVESGSIMMVCYFASRGFAKDLLWLLCAMDKGREEWECARAGLHLYIGTDPRDIRAPAEVIEVGKDVCDEIRKMESAKSAKEAMMMWIKGHMPGVRP